MVIKCHQIQYKSYSVRNSNGTSLEFWLFRVRVDSQDFDPFSIVELPVPCEWPLQELVDLPDPPHSSAPNSAFKRERPNDKTHLTLIHALAHVPEPLPDLVALDEARVGLVEALERGE